MPRTPLMLLALFGALLTLSAPAQKQPPPFASFEIGEHDFLLEGRPFVIRSGEMHFSRVPREYWRHRLQMVRAMGCNTVCAYLFWNMHEPEPGRFDFTGRNDVAEYCRIAAEEGLKVILRPGPYACAEWDFGGFPWWLLKHSDIRLRTRDPVYLDACRNYLREVGRQLAPLQISRGGPIILVQVENEYGSYGNDREYIRELRDMLVASGFEVPLFTCDGPSQLKNGAHPDLFSAVNFGANPQHAFQTLRRTRPSGPLMCGEYYPGWFDRWGIPHRTGATPKILSELGWMLENKASFSIYMAHGGTSFGFTAGANSPPFRPQITSYDYDAPITEAGWATPKFHAIRTLFERYLGPGDSLPAIPEAPPVIGIGDIRLSTRAPLLSRLPRAVPGERPLPMEMHDQSHGLILYRGTLPSGPPGHLVVNDANDLTFAYLDGKVLGTLDRRHGQTTLALPALAEDSTLDLLVHGFGRINFGKNIHDRKGIGGKVEIHRQASTREVRSWNTYLFPLRTGDWQELNFNADPAERPGPYYHRGTFILRQTGDTFLDLRGWARGVVWVNGHNLGRYWNLGPQQTLYCPGPWLREGENEVVILSFEPVEGGRIAGLEKPILNEIPPESTPRGTRAKGSLRLTELRPLHEGRFEAGIHAQTVRFSPVSGRFFCLQSLSSHAGDPHATCAELDLLDASGREILRESWSALHASSEEASEDGYLENVFDLQPTTYWHSRWRGAKPKHPHAFVIDLGEIREISGFRYLPRQDLPNGRIKDFRVFLQQDLFPGLTR